MVKKKCLQSGLIYNLFQQFQEQLIKNIPACLFKTKNQDQTLEFFKEILKNGNLSVKHDNFSDGVAIYEKGNEQQFKSYELHNNLGVLRALQKQYTLAIKCFNISITVQSHQYNALINVANINFLNYQILEGIKMYQQLLEDDKTIQAQENFSAAINFLNSFPKFYERYLLLCSRKQQQSPLKKFIIDKLTQNIDKQTSIIMTYALKIGEIHQLLSLFNKFLKHYHDNFFVQTKQYKDIIQSLFSKPVNEYKEHKLFHNLCLLLIGYFAQIKQPIISLYFFSLIDKLNNTKIKEAYLKLHNNLIEIKQFEVIKKWELATENNNLLFFKKSFGYHVEKLQFFQNLKMYWFHDGQYHLNYNYILSQIQIPLDQKYRSKAQMSLRQSINILKNAAKINLKQIDKCQSISEYRILHQDLNYPFTCLYILTEKYDAALSLLFKTIEINPFNIAYYLTLANLITKKPQLTHQALDFLDEIAMNTNQLQYKVRGNVALFHLYTGNYEHSYSYLCQVIREAHKYMDQIGADLQLIYYLETILSTFDYSETVCKQCYFQCYLYLLLLDMDQGIQAKYINFPKDRFDQSQKDKDELVKNLFLKDQSKRLVFQQIKKFSLEHKDIIYCRIFDVYIKNQEKDPSLVFRQFLKQETQLSNYMWVLQIRNKIRNSKIYNFTKLIQQKQLELLKYFSIQHSRQSINQVLNKLKNNHIFTLRSMIIKKAKYFYGLSQKCPPLCKGKNKYCFYKIMFKKLQQASISFETLGYNQWIRQKIKCFIVELQNLIAQKQYQIHQMISISYRICLQQILQINQNVQRTLLSIFIKFTEQQNQQQFRKQIINLVQHDNDSQNSRIQTLSLRSDSEHLYYIQESDSNDTIDLVGRLNDQNRVTFIGYKKIQLRKIQNQQLILYRIVKFHNENGDHQLIIYVYSIVQTRVNRIPQQIFSSIILINPFNNIILQITEANQDRVFFRDLQALPKYFYRDNDENMQNQQNKIQLIFDNRKKKVYIKRIESQTSVQFTKNQLFIINLFQKGKVDFTKMKKTLFKREV